MMEIHNTAPTPGIPKAVVFPEYYSTTLANGLRLLVIEHRNLPIVSLRVVLRTGSAYDGDIPGLASMTTELLTKSTATRTANQIAEEIDFVGGQLGSGADWDACFVTVNVLSKHLPTGLRILQDVVLNPTFPIEEIARVRDQRLASIMQRRDEPDFLAEREFARTLFRSHPYGSQMEGTPESVTAVGRDDFGRFHNRMVRPNNAILAIVGDISPAEALDRTGEMFGGWQKGDLPVDDLPAVVPPGSTAVRIVDKPEAVQSAIRIGHAGIARKNADFIRVQVLNTLFGGYFQSRINMNLREARGYTYGANSIFEARQHAGPFTVSADVRNDVTGPAISEIIGEMRRIRDERVDGEELDVVKSFIIGSFPLQIETASQIASRAISIELYGLPADFYTTFNEKVAAITAAELQTTAQRYLHPDSAVIAVSGDAGEIAASCTGIGPVTVVDADGYQKA